jgi:hypothetical protein
VADSSSKPAPVDLADCYPERAVGHELDGEKVVLLRPRFIKGPFARWLQPRLRRPYFRVRLDDLGSFVWKLCDGMTKVSEIVTQLEAHFGEGEPQLAKRLAHFFYELERGQMIRMRIEPP